MLESHENYYFEKKKIVLKNNEETLKILNRSESTLLKIKKNCGKLKTLKIRDFTIIIILFIIIISDIYYL